MTDLVIRRATPSDVEVIAANNRAMALETEGKVLDTSATLRGAAALIADEGKGFYLLAERGSEIAGQLMITYEWSDWRNGIFWWIQSVYVSPASRRGGVFRALYRRLHEMAADAGNVCGIRLYVETANARAQATYVALGMQRSHYELYELDLPLSSS
ncbi:N-acetyltransferase GCN5 [Sorangium cellulosum]|uniref:N-acetyltransferase GCN5 n=1 Tax=Sorangium cellulosum TaxID=56 RepID=A0A2L0F3S8_SORCE|nr:GNAT family N-acetyltransferase [Sorangium cellulosum]AUX46234.1 N-acetyltransferase GCN5 [Sorangium cellulosum]